MLCSQAFICVCFWKKIPVFLSSFFFFFFFFFFFGQIIFHSLKCTQDLDKKYFDKDPFIKNGHICSGFHFPDLESGNHSHTQPFHTAILHTKKELATPSYQAMATLIIHSTHCLILLQQAFWHCINPVNKHHTFSMKHLCYNYWITWDVLIALLKTKQKKTILNIVCLPFNGHDNDTE